MSFICLEIAIIRYYNKTAIPKYFLSPQKKHIALQSGLHRSVAYLQNNYKSRMIMKKKSHTPVLFLLILLPEMLPAQFAQLFLSHSC
jgi:hypothetical protein